jgi:hypothetical protein
LAQQRSIVRCISRFGRYGLLTAPNTGINC